MHIQTAKADLGARDHMICEHLPLIRFVVRKMMVDGPGAEVSFEDLVGYGTIGLIQAVERFDGSLGIPFSGFAIPRIRGAVLDALRGLDPLSRGQRLMAKQIAAKQNELAMTFGCEPTGQELRAATGLTGEQFNTARSMAGFFCVPIDNAGDDGLSYGYSEPADPDAESPTAGMERQELLATLERAIKSLPERERIIVGLYYGERLKYREIATVMAVSETRVSQLMQQALGRLRRNPRLAEEALPCSA